MITRTSRFNGTSWTIELHSRIDGKWYARVFHPDYDGLVYQTPLSSSQEDARDAALSWISYQV